MIFLDATTDIAFKKMLGDPRHPSLTISFLNAMLELPEGKRITQISHNNTENLPLAHESSTTTFLDINCTDQEKREYIVEIQRENEGNFIPRAQFYASYCLARQIKRRTDYVNLKPVILLAVVKQFNLFERHDRYLTHHVMQDRFDGVQDIAFSEFHFVELKKFNKKLDEIKNSVTDQWIYLLNNAHELDKIPEQMDNNKEITEAMHLLEHARLSSREFEAYIVQVEAANRIGNVERTAAALAEARGRAEGEARGEARGELTKAHAIAKELLADGMSVAKVAKFTGLSVEDIKNLK